MAINNRKLIIIFSICLGGLLYQSFIQVQKTLEKNSSTILQSPFHLNILPLSFINEPEIIYFKEGQQSRPSKDFIKPYEYIVAASPFFTAVLIAVAVIFFLLANAHLDRHQYLFLSLNIYSLLYFFSFIDYLTENNLLFIFYFVGFSINISFIYFFRSLLDRATSFMVAVYLGLLSVFLTFWLYPSDANSEVFLFKCIGLSQFAVVLYTTYLFISYISKIKKSKKSQQKNTRMINIKIISALIFLFGFCLASVCFFLFNYIETNMNTNYNAFFFLPAFAVGLHTMLGIRFGFIFIKVIINEFLFKIIMILVFTLLYSFFIGFRLYSLFDTETGFFFHLTIVIASLMILDSIRTGITFFLDQSSVKRNIILGEYLSEISYYFNNPENVLTFINKLSKAVKKGLEIHEIKLCFTKKLFTELTLLRADNIFYNDVIWHDIRRKKKFVFYPVFTKYKATKWKNIFQDQHSFLLIAFQKFDAALIVSNKVDKRAFFSSDIKFLRSVIKYGEALLQNYQFFLETTQIRRHQNELSLAASIQKKILPSEYANHRIQLCFIIKPFEEVTGDYIDFFEKNSHEYTILLGDVSGHGLGSAYLMTLTHSMIRASVKILKEKLNRTFTKVNHYLVHDYNGYDFMSLVGVKIQIKQEDKNKKEYAELGFVNAGQHPMLIYLMESKSLIVLSTNQRVLGVADTQYKINTHFFYESFRIFIYSDGIFEVFDHQGKIIGEKEIHDWIFKSGELSIEEQKEFISKKIEKYQDKKFRIIDDISLVIAEIKLER